MPTIPTVTGEVDVDTLGTTLMHEHIIITTPDLQDTFPGFMGYDHDTAVALGQARLKEMKANGIDTIVDLTAPGLGRNVRRVSKAVEGTGMNVIVCTGYYTYTDLPFPMAYNGPGKFFDDPEDDILVSLFVNDIEVGIEGTGIKAGILKCCTDMPGVTPDIDRLIRAVSKAHHKTDVPITTHTHAGTERGLDQQRIFTEEGVDLSRVIIGHSNETTDIGYLEKLLQAGSYIGFDRCGLSLTLDLESQVVALTELLKRGYANQIVLSHDRHSYSDWFPEEKILEVLPQWNYQYVQQGLIPELLERGATQDQIDQMMIRNPRDFFAKRSS